MNDVRNITTNLHEQQNASEAVVEAVADAEGVSTLELRPLLYEVVDPDALDDLATSMTCLPADSVPRVTFQYCGYDVTVSGDDEVTVAASGSRESSGEDVREVSSCDDR